jgi:ribosomal protein L11 methyltransferase
MYLWRRLASQAWLRGNEAQLRRLTGDRLALIERPNRRNLQLEVATKSGNATREIARQFGGRVEKLPANWLKRFLRRKTKPLTIGRRKLIIPAGAAFGTGEHATTAMSLRLLEKVSKKLKPGWSMLDLGTGSGILALAAKSLGAGRVSGLDYDPTAILTAKENARLNGIHGMQFQVADVRGLKIRRNLDVVTANLFSELLIKILPEFNAVRRLILSGILREQEREIRAALERNELDIIEVLHRGKWVAILAACR